MCACEYYSKSQLASHSSLERFIMSHSFSVALTPFPHAHRHTDQPTDRPPTHTMVYIGFPAFSKLLEVSRVFWNLLGPSRTFESFPGHPCSARSAPRAVAWLSPTQNTVACRQLGKLLTLKTFRDHTLLYMTLYSPMASPVAWLTSPRQQLRLMRSTAI